MIYLDYSANTPVDEAVLQRFCEVRWKNRAKGGGQRDNVLVYFFFSSGHGFSLPSCTPRRTQGWW